MKKIIKHIVTRLWMSSKFVCRCGAEFTSEEAAFDLSAHKGA